MVESCSRAGEVVLGQQTDGQCGVRGVGGGGLIGVLVGELQSQVVCGELIEVVEGMLRRAEEILSVGVGQGGGLDADLEGEDRTTGLELVFG